MTANLGALRPRLRPDVEQVVGFDGALLLFDPLAGTYTRLSGPARAVLPLLDGSLSVDEVVARISLERQLPAGRVGPAISRFVSGLKQASLLENVAADPTPGRERLVEAARRVPVLRLRVGGPFEGNDSLLMRLVRRLPVPLVAVTWSVLALCGLGLGVWALLSEGRHFADVTVWVVAAVLITQVTVHETAHAVVCRAAGARVREAGLALWYYVLPVAYIDRTDSYRVRSRRWRTGIALAGPASDCLWIGTVAVLSLDHVLGGTFHVVLVGQILIMMGNFNPFLPSDGEQAFESATGLVTLRADGLSYVAAKLLRVHKPLPSSFSGPRRRLYLVYGTACIAYIAAGASLVGLVAVSLLVRAAQVVAG